MVLDVLFLLAFTHSHKKLDLMKDEFDMLFIVLLLEMYSTFKQKIFDGN